MQKKNQARLLNLLVAFSALAVFVPLIQIVFVISLIQSNNPNNRYIGLRLTSKALLRGNEFVRRQVAGIVLTDTNKANREIALTSLVALPLRIAAHELSNIVLKTSELDDILNMNRVLSESYSSIEMSKYLMPLLLDGSSRHELFFKYASDFGSQAILNSLLDFVRDNSNVEEKEVAAKLISTWRPESDFQINLLLDLVLSEESTHIRNCLMECVSQGCIITDEISRRITVHIAELPMVARLFGLQYLAKNGREVRIARLTFLACLFSNEERLPLISLNGLELVQNDLSEWDLAVISIGLARPMSDLDIGIINLLMDCKSRSWMAIPMLSAYAAVGDSDSRIRARDAIKHITN